VIKVTNLSSTFSIVFITLDKKVKIVHSITDKKNYFRQMRQKSSHMPKRVIGFFIFLFYVLTCHEGIVFGQQFSFVPYSVKDGLAQTQVYSICSDNEGYLWFGTAGGASKFDGSQFNNYSTANGLTGNVVLSIQNYQGYLWIFSKNGVSRIKGKEIISFNFSTILQGESINLAYFHPTKKELWISARNIGIIILPLNKKNEPDISEANPVPLPNEDAVNPRVLLFDDQTDRLYLGSNGYLGFYQNEKWQELVINESDYNISDVKLTKQGELLVSVYDEGIYWFGKNKIRQMTEEEDGISSNLIRNIFVDSKNRIWLASKNGVTLIENKNITVFHEYNGLPNENIETIFEDREGNIWFGTDGSGTFRYTSDEFITYTTSNGLSSNYAMTILQDDNQRYWIGTYGGGITTLKGNDINYYSTTNNKLSNNIIWCGLLDAEKNMWFGTSDGLVKFENEIISTFRNEWFLPSPKVTSLYQDHQGFLYVGTAKGLALRKEGKWFKYDDSIGINLKNIRCIEKGMNQKIWLGTSNGIYVFDEKMCEPWINNDILEDKVVYSICNYKDSLWFIGTANGLYASNGYSCDKIELHPSFSANFINFLGLERENYLWIGTNFGIFELDIHQYFVKKNKKGILHHTSNSGITSVETNLNAFFEDRDKNIWMGTGDGVVKFDRKKRKDTIEITVPQTYISDIQLFLKPTNWEKYSNNISPYSGLPNELTLSSKVNYLTFYFTSICYSQPKDVKFRIRLEGLDEDWSPVIDQHSFTYPNLSYGEYTFMVASSIDGTHWSEPAIFHFSILKPYYLTWWFFLLVALFFTSIILAIIKWRQHVNERERLTEKLLYKSRLLALEQQSLNASMNRHFIFNALNSIQYYINTQDRLSANKYLTSFAKLIRKNLDSSIANNGMVTLTDELERLELYISLEMMRFQEKFEYICTIDPQLNTDNILIPSMILQPFIENSIWHGILPLGSKGKISLTISQDNENYQFEIEDNGIGVNTSLSGKTNNEHQSKGMLITSGRIDVLKKVNEQKMSIEGPFEVYDIDGKTIGTKVVIRLEKQKM
jgi:ligand-binding sensor domain-containing protein